MTSLPLGLAAPGAQPVPLDLSSLGRGTNWRRTNPPRPRLAKDALAAEARSSRPRRCWRRARWVACAFVVFFLRYDKETQKATNKKEGNGKTGGWDTDACFCLVLRIIDLLIYF